MWPFRKNRLPVVKIKLDEESVALLERLEKIGPNIAAIKIVECSPDAVLVFEYPEKLSPEVLCRTGRTCEQQTKRRCLILHDGMTLAGVVQDPPEGNLYEPSDELTAEIEAARKRLFPRKNGKSELVDDDVLTGRVDLLKDIETKPNA